MIEILKKINRFLIENTGIAYVILLIIFLISSYLITNETIEYSIYNYVIMSSVLLFSLILSLAFQIFGTYIIMKLVKIKADIKYLHKLIMCIMTQRVFIGALVYMTIHRYTIIANTVNSIISLCYAIFLIYCLKVKYEMNILKTILSSILFVALLGLIRLLTM